MMNYQVMTRDSRSPNITMKNLAFSTNEIWLGTVELANIVGQSRIVYGIYLYSREDSHLWQNYIG